MKKTIPVPNQNLKLKKLIVAAAIVSIVAYVLVQFFLSKNAALYSDTMIRAAEIMDKAIITIGEHCDQVGIPIDESIDPNRTGLIGAEISPIATTLGNLEAKRTTTNPAFAAIIVHLLEQSGVSKGDTIAIGCSASFPALMVASLAAVKALEAHPIIIISLGSSSFGATNPNFNLLHIYEDLFQQKIFDLKPAAISLGGDQDVGRDFDPEIRNKLVKQIHLSGIPFIFEADLLKNIARRMEIYLGDSSENSIAAFINIGGSYANIGTSELVLKMKPGINEKMQIPPKGERGALFEMAVRRIPTIHLLYVRGLALRYGLPWDPIPLPKAGESELLLAGSHRNFQFWIITVLYFLVLLGLLIYGKIWTANP